MFAPLTRFCSSALFRALVVLSILASWCSESDAATISWANPVTGIWNDPSNWSPPQIPTVADDVIIDVPGSYTVRVQTGGSAGNITLSAPGVDAKLRVLNSTLTCEGFVVDPSGVLRILSNSAPAALNVSMTLECGGDVFLAGSQGDATLSAGTTIVESTGTLTTSIGSGVAVVSGFVENRGAIDVERTTRFESSLHIEAGGSFQVTGIGTAELNGPGLTELRVRDDANVNAPGGIEIVDGSFEVEQNTLSPTISGTITVRGGAFGIGTVGSPQGTVSGVASLVAQGTSTLNGDVWPGANLIVQGSLAGGHAVLQPSSSLENYGTVTLTSIDGVFDSVVQGAEVWNRGGSSALQVEAGTGGARTFQGLLTEGVANLQTNTTISGGVSLESGSTMTIASGTTTEVQFGTFVTVRDDALLNATGQLELSSTSFQIEQNSLSPTVNGTIAGTDVSFDLGDVGGPQGTVSGSATILARGNTNLSGDVWPGANLVVQGSLAGGHAVLQPSSSLENYGTVTLTSIDGVFDSVVQGAEVWNRGGSSALQVEAGTGGVRTFQGLLNEGVANIQTNTTISGGVSLESGSTMTIASGTTTEVQFGTFVTVRDDALLNATGQLELSSTSFQIEQNSLSPTVNGTIAGTDVSFDLGDVGSPQGTVSGSATILARGNTNLSGDVWPGANLVVQGSLAGGHAVLQPSSSLENYGTVTLTSIDGVFDSVVQGAEVWNRGGSSALQVEAGTGGVRTFQGLLNEGVANIQTNTTISGGVSLESGSTMTIASGTTTEVQFGTFVTVRDDALLNATGQLELSSTSFQIEQNSLSPTVNGTIAGTDVSFDLGDVGGPQGTVSGSATILARGNTNLSGDVWPNCLLIAESDSAAGAATLTSEASVHGILRLASLPGLEATLMGNINVHPGGTLDGVGTVTSGVQNDGTVSPGTSSGHLDIGLYSPSTSGVLQIELGGTDPSEYDRVTTSSSMMLQGILDVSLINGFTPAVGDSFTVLTSTGRSFQFDTVNGLNLGGGLALFVNYTANDVILEVFEPGQELWEDVANAAVESVGGEGVAWVDYDGDGDHDLFLANGNTPDKLLRNDGGDDFVDVTVAPLGGMPAPRGAEWADIDNDGDLDLYLSLEQAPNQLIRNDGASGFTDVTTAPIDHDLGSEGAAWCDYDNDGLVDLYVTTAIGTDFLFRNQGGAVFADVTAPPLGDLGFSFDASWSDFDDDGDPDLYVVVFDGSNKLFRNDGAMGFADVTSGPLGDPGRGVGASWGDADNDGDMDLFLSTRPGAGTTSRLLRNDGSGAFANVTTPPLGAILDTQGAEFADYDNDGDLDLFVGTGGGVLSTLFRNDGGLSFVDATMPNLAEFDDGKGIGWCDYDDDGDLDLFVAVQSGNRLFRNDRLVAADWVELDLVGTVSNAAALGARVRVVAGGNVLTREVACGAGYVSQNSQTLHFGLGAAASIDSVVVTWPSGIVQPVPGVTPGTRVIVVEIDVVDAPPDALLPVPVSFALHRNAPNPFGTSTRIDYDLPVVGAVRMQVFDVQGRRVRTLVDVPSQSPGRYQVQWRGRDDLGRRVAPGVYFYRLEASGFRGVGRMALIR